MKVKVRKELVLCSNCKNPKAFFYLSDFAYGERLFLINDRTEYAYVNLFEDEVYDEFNDIVDIVLKNLNIKFPKDKLAEVVNDMFGITCDSIKGKQIDTSLKDDKCIKCGSKEFESNLIEPVQYIDLEVSLITHKLWEGMDNKEKHQYIVKELQNKNYIF